MKNTIYSALRFYNTFSAIFKGKLLKRLFNIIIGRYVVSKLWFR